MRTVLEESQGRRVYIFTTHGMTFVGRVEQVEERVVRLTAPDGRTRLVVNLSDVSGVRQYDEAQA